MAVKLLSLWLGLVLLVPAMAQSQQQLEVSTAAERQQLQQQLEQSRTLEQRLDLLVRLTEVFVTQDPALSLTYAKVLFITEYCCSKRQLLCCRETTNRPTTPVLKLNV